MARLSRLLLVAFLIAIAGWAFTPASRAQEESAPAEEAAAEEPAAEESAGDESADAAEEASPEDLSGEEPAATDAEPASCSAEEKKFEPGPKQLRVMTFNIWGIVSAKERLVRAEAIGRRIALLNPDVIAIEEAFEKRHRVALLKGMKAGGYEPVTVRYFRHHAYGSGILLISKFPLEKVIFEPYRINGAKGDIEHLGGKGVAYARLKTPWGPLDFFLTHVIARMTEAFDKDGEYIPGDPKINDRLVQVWQADRFVRHHRSREGRAVIAAGDFNISPEMLEYKFLVSLTGFENSFDAVNPDRNPSTFSKDNKWANGEYSRIDHIFFKNYAGKQGFWVKPAASIIEMKAEFTNPKDNKQIHYSDHYAVVTDFDVITEEGGVQPSPEGVVPTACPPEECVLTGYADGKIHLDANNIKYWQNLALAVYLEAFKDKDRENPLIAPMAEVIAAGEAAEAVDVPVPPEADYDLVDRLGCCCAQTGG